MYSTAATSFEMECRVYNNYVTSDASLLYSGSYGRSEVQHGDPLSGLTP